MKITHVKTAAVRANFEWILVRVLTDEGLVGLGECYWGAGVETVARHLERLLVGEDPHNVDWLYQKMIRGMSGAGSTGGTVVAAISGVELALWDLKGQALNTPIYNLLGGKHRERIRMYADCGQGDEPTAESWVEKAAAAVAKGFGAIKFDVDRIDPQRFADPFHVGVGKASLLAAKQQARLSNREIDLIVRLAGAVREAIGPDVDLALDCHWNYNTRDAITLARELAGLKLMWLEDPTPPDNVDALKRVTDSSPVPICSGENHYTRHGLRRMITTQAVDVLQPDIPKAGGLLEAKKIADLADIYYIPLAGHNVCSPVGTVASCHACASMRNFAVMEFHALGVPWWDDLVMGEGPLIRDGHIELPAAAGLGVELNEDVARAHLSEGSTFFE